MTELKIPPNCRAFFRRMSKLKDEMKRRGTATVPMPGIAEGIHVFSTRDNVKVHPSAAVYAEVRRGIRELIREVELLPKAKARSPFKPGRATFRTKHGRTTYPVLPVKIVREKNVRWVALTENKVSDLYAATALSDDKFLRSLGFRKEDFGMLLKFENGRFVASLSLLDSMLPLSWAESFYKLLSGDASAWKDLAGRCFIPWEFINGKTAALPWYGCCCNVLLPSGEGQGTVILEIKKPTAQHPAIAIIHVPAKPIGANATKVAIVREATLSINGEGNLSVGSEKFPCAGKNGRAAKKPKNGIRPGSAKTGLPILRNACQSWEALRGLVGSGKVGKFSVITNGEGQLFIGPEVLPRRFIPFEEVEVSLFFSSNKVEVRANSVKSKNKSRSARVFNV